MSKVFKEGKDYLFIWVARAQICDTQFTSCGTKWAGKTIESYILNELENGGKYMNRGPYVINPRAVFIIEDPLAPNRLCYSVDITHKLATCGATL